MEAQNALREMALLWSDHFWLTREFITQTASGYPGAKETGNRLFENQVQLGNNLALFYGSRNGNYYGDLLHDHIAIASEIVGNAIHGKDITALNTEWQINGQAISTFLSKVNPFIDFQTMNRHFMNHLSTTLAEAVAIISKNYQDSIIKGDIAKDHVNMMSRYIEQAIKRQIGTT